MDRLMQITDTLDRWTTAVLDALVVAMAGLLLILLNWAVFARFVLNDSVSSVSYTHLTLPTTPYV